MTYLTHTLITLNQTMHSLDSQEAIIDRHILLAPVQHIRRDNGSQIMDIHLAPALLVHVREGRDPVEESEQDLHRVAVGFGQETAGQMQDAAPAFAVLDPLRRDPEFVKLVRKERVREFAEELLQQGGDLDGVFAGQVDFHGALGVDFFFYVVQAFDVAVLPEHALDGHVHCLHRADGFLD